MLVDREPEPSGGRAGDMNGDPNGEECPLWANAGAGMSRPSIPGFDGLASQAIPISEQNDAF